MGLAYFSLANEGLHPDLNTTENCKPVGFVDCTMKTINTPFATNPIRASYIITACDCTYSLLFLLFIYYFQNRVDVMIQENKTKHISPGAYSIFIRGLPLDATEEEILEHFDVLYDLEKPKHRFPMWFGFLGQAKEIRKQFQIEGAEKVTNLDHVRGDEMYMNKWVAQVTIAYRTKGLLRAFLSMEKLTSDIANRKAICKIYDEENDLKHVNYKEAAHQKLAKKESKLKKKMNNLSQLKNGAAIKQDCECAFLIFNNTISRDRCLHDYRTSTGSVARYFQPKMLRFRGKHPLQVVEAPEPSNIIWQNLEVSGRERFYR